MLGHGMAENLAPSYPENVKGGAASLFTEACKLQKHTCAVADEEVVQAMVHAAHQEGHALHLVVIEQLPLHAEPVGHLHSTSCRVAAEFDPGDNLDAVMNQYITNGSLHGYASSKCRRMDLVLRAHLSDRAL